MHVEVRSQHQVFSLFILYFFWRQGLSWDIKKLTCSSISADQQAPYQILLSLSYKSLNSKCSSPHLPFSKGAEDLIQVLMLYQLSHPPSLQDSLLGSHKTLI